MSFQKCPVLLLEGFTPMMLVLIADIILNLRNLGFAYRKRAVSILPTKGISLACDSGREP
jgi:hypothetical protein